MSQRNSKAMGKITKGLVSAIRHATCSQQHQEHHVSTKIGASELQVECRLCGASWTEEYRKGRHAPIKVIRPMK